MHDGTVIRLATESLYLALWISLPALAVSAVIGVLIGLLQSVTQVQEQTLTFVPKLVAVSFVLMVAGGWMGHELLRFTANVWDLLPMIRE